MPALGALLIRGFLGGVIATAPMTLAMLILKRSAPQETRQEKLPPQEITENMTEKINRNTPATVPEEPVKHREGEFSLPTLVAHYGYGGATGALYPSLLMRRWPDSSPALKGAIYGLMVWSGSYLGLLPTARLYPRADQKPAGLNAVMITAHLVWGAALGLFCQSKISAHRPA